MSNIDYYNKLAKIYDIIYSDKYIGAQTDAEIKFLSKYISKDSIILDIGCGTGRHVLKLAPMVHKIVGIDNSNEMLNLARQKSKDFHQCEFKLVP